MHSVLIIFPDEHLPYSPTILNLAKKLQTHCRVNLVSFSSKHFGTVNEPFVTYLSIPFLQKKVYGAINRVSKKSGNKILAFLKKAQIQRHLKKFQYDDVIATDPISVWMLKGFSDLRLHMVSLELTQNTTDYIYKVNLQTLASLIIQSKERKEALVKDFQGEIFYLQNAPDYNPTLEKNKVIPEYNTFVYSGTAYARFGIFQCLDFLKVNPETRMSLIGKVPEAESAIIQEKYSDLLTKNRLDIIGKYFDSDEMLKTISTSRIGFCFYDFSFKQINNINYLTAPSGKMFAYFAAGVPVIGIRIPGLKPIEEFHAGVLIDDMKSDSIKKAVEIIDADYNSMVAGCFRAAKHFSFETAVIPFVNYILKNKK